MKRCIRCFDLFCGVGGSSCGASLAGVEVVGGLDAWDVAATAFKLNFPQAKVWTKRAEEVDPYEVASELGNVDLMLASPECTNHSTAKTRGPRSEASRSTAFEVVRFAKALSPRWIVVENVPMMRRWCRYNEWLSQIHNLGYKTLEVILNANDFSVPQSRVRLFVLCDREREPTPPQPLRGDRPTIRDIIGAGEDINNPWEFKPLFYPKRAQRIINRAKLAIKRLGHGSSFILAYHGSKWPGFFSLDKPMRTLTTSSRWLYVRYNGHDYESRMLKIPELAKAMGFPQEHRLPDIPVIFKEKLLGNAVCPPVMYAIVSQLTGSQNEQLPAEHVKSD
jgi:DNA (cytosine-5)-methyltransferase 1